MSYENWKNKAQGFQTVDVRHIQGSFFEGLKKRAEALEVGEGLHIIQIFEPHPLYAVMEGLGYEHHTERRSEAEFHVWFCRVEKKEGDSSAPFKPLALLNYPMIDEKLGQIAVDFWETTWQSEKRVLPYETRLLLSLTNAVGAGRMRQAARFHAPQPPQPWAEPLDASSYGCVCPLLSIDKPSGELRVPHRYWVQDEDCLNLNIWTPACDAQKRPVLVWLHGGGFFAGSSIEQVAYEGGNMAREGDCVVVSLNHRLNILGYLDLSDFGEEYANSGNAGGEDIILALRWVRDNIAAFGGDPGCVTVFGQSGGGAKVTTLLQTPAADGLYHRAMIMSGVLEGLLNDSVGSGRDCVQALMQELGVQTAQQLETVPYHQLAQAYRNVSPALKAKGANVGQSPHPNRFYLGDPLQNGSGFRPETADIPVLIGTVYSEFYGFFDGLKGVSLEEAVGLSAAETLREQFRTAYPHRPEEDLLLADTSFRAPTIKYVRERAMAGGKVYSYLFDQDFPLMGKSTPWHCADIPFVFHNTELVPVCAFEGAKQLEAKIFGAVMQFARTGAPGWAASTEDVEQTMLFGPQSRLVQNHDHALIEALAPFTDLRMKKATRAGGQIQH